MIEGTPPPGEHTILTVIDRATQATAKGMVGVVAPIVRAETPRHGGELADRLRPRSSRTSRGWAVTVAVPRGAREPGTTATLAEVIRYVTRGTGVKRVGPGPKRRITAKPPKRAMSIFGRRVYSDAGQEPNPFMDRIRERGTPQVVGEAGRGADELAREVERAVARP